MLYCQKVRFQGRYQFHCARHFSLKWLMSLTTTWVVRFLTALRILVVRFQCWICVKIIFRGIIPTTFTEENSLRTLNYNGNHLEGTLDRSLLNCKKLEVLDIGHINQTGRIISDQDYCKRRFFIHQWNFGLQITKYFFF